MMAVLSWIHAVCLAAGTYLPAAELMGKTQQESFWYLSRVLWLFLPVAASWYGIRRIRNLGLYCCFAAGISAAVWLIVRCPQTLLLSIFCFLIRCLPRISKGNQLEDYPEEAEEFKYWEIPTVLDRPSVPCWFFLVLLYFVLIFMKAFDHLRTVFWLLVLEIFLTYAYTSLERIKEFIKSSKRIANLPVRTMQRIQRGILAVTVLLLAVFVLPSVLYGQEPLTGIAEWKLELGSGTFMMEEEQAPEEPGLEEMLEMYGAGEYKEAPKWLTSLMNLLFYILLMGGLAAIALIVYQFCRRMMRSFEDGQSQDEVIWLEEDTDIRVNLRKKSGLRANTNNEKIRRSFRKIIRKASKQKKPQGWETPQELENRFVWAAEQDREEAFRRIYEKARYSAAQCSSEEAAYFREMQKRKCPIDKDAFNG